MKLNLSMRLKIFIISVIIIISGQIFYSYKNVKFFQESYIENLRYKSFKIGNFFKEDIEFILNYKIPITKLINLEKTIMETLEGVNELEFIEITDLKKRPLYYADHKKMEKITPGSKSSLFYDETEINRIQSYNLSTEDTDIIIPIYYSEKKEIVGHINMRLDPENIISKSNRILYDMITIIMTSLIVTFELLTFFVSYGMKRPVEDLELHMKESTVNLTPLPETKFLYFKDLRIIIDKFNLLILNYVKELNPVISMQNIFPEFSKSFNKITDSQKKNLIEAQKSKQFLRYVDNRNILLDKLLKNISKAEELLEKFKKRLNSFNGYPHAKQNELQTNPTTYTFIRPVIFLFLMADAFSISFLPLFVEELYKSSDLLPKEVVIAMPLSVFMLFLALTMPVAGRITDRIGWYKPLITGLLINITGLFLTSTATNITLLTLYRCITAVGYSLVFISCQKFIIDNTDIKNRAFGMAFFLAAFFGGDVCGTVIGGMLAERISYAQVFFLSGVFASLTGIVTLILLSNKKNDFTRKKSSEFSPFTKNLFKVLKDKEFLAILVLQAIPAKMVLVGVLYFSVPLYLKQLGVSQSNIARILISYSFIVFFIGPLISNFVTSRKKIKLSVFLGGLTTGLSLVFLNYFHTPYSVFIMVTMIGVGQSFSIAPQVTLISETNVIKKIGVGEGLGIFKLWERIGNVTAPLIMGFITSYFDYSTTMLLTGFLCLIFSILYFLTFYNSKEIS